MKILKRFTLPNCPPCQMIEDILDDLELKVEQQVIDVRSNQQLAMQLGLKSFPTLIVYENGKEIGRSIGFSGEDRLLLWLKTNQLV